MKSDCLSFFEPILQPSMFWQATYFDKLDLRMRPIFNILDLRLQFRSEFHVSWAMPSPWCDTKLCLLFAWCEQSFVFVVPSELLPRLMAVHRFTCPHCKAQQSVPHEYLNQAVSKKKKTVALVSPISGSSKIFLNILQPSLLCCICYFDFNMMCGNLRASNPFRPPNGCVCLREHLLYNVRVE